jgi:outer membrane receptor protein involved in Fe transport
MGVEAELRVRYPWMYATLSYSFYEVVGVRAPDGNYTVPGHDGLNIDAPAHKVTLNAGVNVWRDRLTIGATLVYMSERFGFTSGDGMGMGVLGSEPNVVLLGANAAYHNLGVRGLDLTVGASNLLGQRYQVLSIGDHAPVPMGGREVFARLSYNFGGH